MMPPAAVDRIDFCPGSAEPLAVRLNRLQMKVAFVTHYCTHYRIKTYEALARRVNVKYFFYSAGREWYWDRSHGVSKGTFDYEYLPGFQLGHTRIAPSLVWKLMGGPYDVYVKCINGKFALPATYLVARLRGKPFVLWTGLWIRLRTPMHWLIWPLTRYIYRHSDAVVTYGTHVAAFLEREGVSPEKLFPARHAVDNDKFARPASNDEKAAVRSLLGVSADDRIVLYVGRLVEMKGLQYLLAAFARLRFPAVLVLAGQGPLEDALRQQAQTLGIEDRLRFAGYVPTSETPRYYAIAWVHVLPSVTTGGMAGEGREPWGLVVNEAFNQGVPSVVTDAVGAAAGGLVTHDETGIVVPERDEAKLADGLDRVLGDEGLRNRLGENARQRVMGWNNDEMAETFVDAVVYATQVRGVRQVAVAKG
jgi:glycosyltransferase involved in cell wall biosynthesis